MMDASREIEDPTDWLNTSLANFLPLDNALRCQVCKDFYDTPMITSCFHTFCSKCIRTCISNDGKCPTCRAAEQASKLRNNLAVEEAVGAFKIARPAAYKIALKDKQEDDEEPRRAGKRRKISHEAEEVDEAVNGRRQTRSMRSTRGAAPSAQVDGPVEIEDSDEDEDYTPEDGLVACPICSTRMKEQDVSPHLDGECDGTKKKDKVPRARNTPQKPPAPPQRQQQQQPSRTSRPSKPQDRLAELNYTLMNDNQLRKKFLALGIPATGRKELMKDRYTAWADIWNANCDSSHPKTKSELLNELKKWERTQGSQAKEGDSAGIMKKDFDAAGWQSNNKSDFARLIEEARKRRNQVSKPATKSSSPEKQSPLEGEGVQAMDMNPNSTTSSLHQDMSDPPPPTAQTHPPHNGSGEDPYRPYENNPEAMSSIREKVKALNADKHIEPVMNEGFKITVGNDVPRSGQETTPSLHYSRNTRMTDSSHPDSEHSDSSDAKNGARVPGLRKESSLGEHFAEIGARKMNMFRVPEEPVSDNEEAH